MGTPVTQFCPLCRCSLCEQDAVRTHLIADHKRSAAQAEDIDRAVQHRQANSRARAGTAYLLRTCETSGAASN
jgi:hypothetical protein